MFSIDFSNWKIVLRCKLFVFHSLEAHFEKISCCDCIHSNEPFLNDWPWTKYPIWRVNDSLLIISWWLAGQKYKNSDFLRMTWQMKKPTQALLEYSMINFEDKQNDVAPSNSFLIQNLYSISCITTKIGCFWLKLRSGSWAIIVYLQNNWPYLSAQIPYQ